MPVDRRHMNRARILESAVEILDHGVYGDLTVDALARSLRMSKSTLYKYFASKDEVVVSVVAATCDGTDAELGRLDRTTGGLSAVLTRLVALVADHAARTPRAVVLQQARLPSTCQDRISVTRASLGRVAEEILTQAEGKGLAKGIDPVLAAIGLMASAEAAMRAAARGEVQGTRSEAVVRMYRVISPGLLG